MIKSSAAADIRQLIAALGGGDEVRREAAIARLAVFGPRAVDGLLRAYAAAADRETKIAVLRALEPSGDRRLIGLARQAIAEGGDVAVSAAAALRGLLDSKQGSSGADALDVLVAAVLDRALDRRVRLAAFEALQGMPERVRARVAAALQADPDPALASRIRDASREAAADDAVWQDALDGRLPDGPDILRDVVQRRAATAALSDLRKLIEAVRTREGAAGGPKRAAWLEVRGALHQGLALRGSRVAVYDLRETVQGLRGRLPGSFLAALHVIGDESCLEPIAAAYSRATDESWKAQLAAAFRAIAKREKLTRRHAVVKRIAAKWPDAGRELTR